MTKFMVKVLAISFFSLFNIKSFAAAPNDKTCISSTIINGVKVDLSLTKPIIVDKKTNFIEKNDFYSDGPPKFPSLKINFTVLDKSIEWYYGKFLFEYEIWYSNENLEMKHEKLHTRAFINNDSPSITLSKGMKTDIELSLNRFPISQIKFTEMSQENGFYFIISTYDQSDYQRGGWWAPIKLCLKANWQYKD